MILLLFKLKLRVDISSFLLFKIERSPIGNIIKSIVKPSAKKTETNKNLDTFLMKSVNHIN